jgi:hypothetical protein
MPEPHGSILQYVVPTPDAVSVAEKVMTCGVPLVQPPGSTEQLVDGAHLSKFTYPVWVASRPYASEPHQSTRCDPSLLIAIQIDPPPSNRCTEPPSTMTFVNEPAVPVDSNSR